MTVRKPAILAAAAALAASAIAPAFAAGVKDGPMTFLRKGDQEIVVFVYEGKLYCRRTSDDYEMCNGMTEQPDGTWKGKRMKHPDMPGFMRFNGTVTFTEAGLNIRGCALGICDAEDWVLKK